MIGKPHILLTSFSTVRATVEQPALRPHRKVHERLGSRLDFWKICFIDISPIPPLNFYRCGVKCEICLDLRVQSRSSFETKQQENLKLPPGEPMTDLRSDYSYNYPILPLILREVKKCEIWPKYGICWGFKTKQRI